MLIHATFDFNNVLVNAEINIKINNAVEVFILRSWITIIYELHYTKKLYAIFDRNENTAVRDRSTVCSMDYTVV